MNRIFISYKRTDKKKVFRLKRRIEYTIKEKCWLDLDGIESDEQFISVIMTAINDAQIVLFMYSSAHKNKRIKLCSKKREANRFYQFGWQCSNRLV